MKLDHIAIAGETLAEATGMVQERLGVSLVPGGQHAVFGTHNQLLGLADGLYLEAIAIDPSAPTPARPRWFDLDRFKGPARLTNWICQTADIEADLKGLPDGMGRPVDLLRGALGWRMAVPATGVLPFDNCAPALIQWTAGNHPSTVLPDAGCRLHRLIITHPDAAQLQGMLTPHLTDPRLVFDAGTTALIAEIDTPHGRRVLT